MERPVIRRGIPHDLLPAAAGLLLDAFPLKVRDELRPRSDEQALAIIARSVDPECAWVALDDSGALLGVIGVSEPGRPFQHVRFSTLVELFGRVRSFARWARAALTHSLFRPRDGQWHIDVLAVCSTSRGLGVGTLLIDAVRNAARDEGIHSIHLEVVDTNPRAQALYTKLGFRSTFTLHTGPLTASAGYRGAYLMRLDLEADGARPT